MAFLRRLPRSPYWIGGFTLPDGSRTQRSTKCKEYKQAYKIVTSWEEAAQRRITESQARRVLSDIHEQVHGTRITSPSLKDYTNQWLSRKMVETANKTYISYKQAADNFIKFLDNLANEPIHFITTNQITKWRDLSAAKASSSTANNKLKIIRVLFESAWREGLITDNPAKKVPSLKTKEGSRRPFTVSELKLIIHAASLQWKGMILFGLYTGQRLSDIASLTWSNIDLSKQEVRLSTSKTGRRQIIPLSDPLISYLNEIEVSDVPDAPLFHEAFKLTTKKGGTSQLSQQFYELLVSVGLAKKRLPKHKSNGTGRDGKRERSSLSFHSLRHTATSMLKEAGASEAVTRDIIGHESAEISRHYTHVDEKSKRAALKLLPNITN
jgi:integrase